MKWNFDEPVGREGSNCIKYDLRKETFGDEKVIPMWVADMDFRTPDFIVEALSERVKHDIYGYSFRPDEYFSSIIEWMRVRHDFNVEKEWICFSPGIVPALNICTLAFTNEGDNIIVQPPVYFPFFSAVESHGRKLVYNQLKESDGNWEMDFDNLKRIIDEKTKMIIISNPHNPVGRVWTAEELHLLADICIKNNILILSDEIHCDLVMPGYRHVPLAGLSESIASSTVTCIAPSKTFNLAGLATSSLIIPDQAKRKLFNNTMEKLHFSNGNIFGTVASIAAYSKGHEWLDQLMNYLNGNAEYVIQYLKNFIPEMIPAPLEATYLMWIDCRKLGMTGKELQKFFISKAHIGMNEGSTFGPGGEGFMRMNLACPRENIIRALGQIEAAVSALR